MLVDWRIVSKKAENYFVHYAKRAKNDEDLSERVIRLFNEDEKRCIKSLKKENVVRCLGFKVNKKFKFYEKVMTIFLIFCFSFYFSFSQSIYISGTKKGEILKNGQIFVAGTKVGQITNNIVFIQGKKILSFDDADIFDSNGLKLGTFYKNAGVFIKSNRKIGEIHRDGAIYQNGIKIGACQNIKKDWAGILIFFTSLFYDE